MERVRMPGLASRSRHEEHRSATPLELFFDLCFVVAVAQAGALLANSIVDGHPGHALAGYLFVFFGIWWAWVNFTWFASAYDSDDVLYRLATLVQIAGALVLAAGVPRAFDQGDFSVAVTGYVIMRAALAFQWLRAAAGERGPARRTALRYAIGLVVLQAAWIVLLVVAPHSLWYPGFVVIAAAELCLPAYAERQWQTPWHPRHVAERYGLFTIITLGETVAAATVAVQSALDLSAVEDLLPVAAGGLLIVFAAYWIYFSVPIERHLQTNRQAFAWGYGHFFIFSSAAAIGAGLEVAVEQTAGEALLPAVGAAAAVTVPTALFLFAVWMFHARFGKHGTVHQLLLPVSALLVLVATLAGRWAVPLTGLLCAGTVAVGVALTRRQAAVAR